MRGKSKEKTDRKSEKNTLHIHVTSQKLSSLKHLFISMMTSKSNLRSDRDKN